MEKKILLMVGGGHSHICLIKNIREERPDFKTILISEKRFQYYSGMASAYMENIYSDEEIAFDLEKLAKKAGVEFFQNRVIAIDSKEKKVTLDNGLEISFSIASFDTGSELLIPDEFQNCEEIIGIKPLSNLKKIKGVLKSDFRKDIKISILGGGAAGVEFALALKEFEKQIEKNFQVRILDKGTKILSTFDKWLQKNAEKEIEKKGITLFLGCEIAKIESNKITAKNIDNLEKIIEFDYLIWAGGPSANIMYKKSGLSTDKKGYMLVNSQLQSLDYPYIFGAGDCVALKDYDYMKKVGVYAIREAPYLWKNILNYFNGTPLETFIPQKKNLLIISLGGKKAMLNYCGIKLKGKLCWRIKDVIDSSFMKKFQKQQD